jgi:hypothetical protein
LFIPAQPEAGLFTDPELARVGINEMEAKAHNIAYRLFKVPKEANLRALTLSEKRGFLKALVAADSDRILGFTPFGVGAGEIMSAVQMAMIAGLPYSALRDAALTHPILVERLIPLFSSVPSAHDVVGATSTTAASSISLEDSNQHRRSYGTVLATRSTITGCNWPLSRARTAA